MYKRFDKSFTVNSGFLNDWMSNECKMVWRYDENYCCEEYVVTPSNCKRIKNKNQCSWKEKNRTKDLNLTTTVVSIVLIKVLSAIPNKLSLVPDDVCLLNGNRNLALNTAAVSFPWLKLNK